MEQLAFNFFEEIKTKIIKYPNQKNMHVGCPFCKDSDCSTAIIFPQNYGLKMFNGFYNRCGTCDNVYIDNYDKTLIATYDINKKEYIDLQEE